MKRWLREVGTSDFPKQPHGKGTGKRKICHVKTEKIANQAPTTKGKNLPAIIMPHKAVANSRKPTDLTNIKDEGKFSFFQAS